jgi:uncharacterized protein YkwD
MFASPKNWLLAKPPTLTISVIALCMCGCPPAGGGGETETAVLRFINDTSLTCTALFASPSSSSTWGASVLSSEVGSGGSQDITNIPSNTSYDFKADFSNGSHAQAMGITFDDRQTLTWTLTDSDLEGGSEGEGEGEGGASQEILQLELDAHDDVNAERTSRGLGALIMREDLRLVARAHSEDMVARDFFTHENPDGESPYDRMGAAGITYRSAAENIAWNSYPNTVERAVDGWMNSEGHRTNILNGNYSHGGMGVASDGNGGYYFTQVFIGLSKTGAGLGDLEPPVVVEFYLPPPLAISHED